MHLMFMSMSSGSQQFAANVAAIASQTAPLSGNLGAATGGIADWRKCLVERPVHRSSVDRSNFGLARCARCKYLFSACMRGIESTCSENEIAMYGATDMVDVKRMRISRGALRRSICIAIQFSAKVTIVINALLRNR